MSLGCQREFFDFVCLIYMFSDFTRKRTKRFHAYPGDILKNVSLRMKMPTILIFVLWVSIGIEN
jgi:hypothetical protein